MTDRARAYLYGGAAVLFWSTVATAFKLALRTLDPLQLLLVSTVTSAVVLGLIVVATGRLRLIRAFSARDFGRSALLGVLNPFLYYLVLFRAYDLLPAQQAQPLNYTWPIVLVLLSIPLLRQRIGLRSIAAVCISFVGVLMISTAGRLSSLRVDNPEGVALAVGSSVIWALYWIFNVRDDRDAIAKLFVGFAFGTVLVVPVALAFGAPLEASAEGLAAAVYVGLFEMGLTFVVWLRALERARTTAQVSVLVYLSPFLSLVFIRFVLGERILPSTLVGLIFIVAGILIQQWGDVFAGNRGE